MGANCCYAIIFALNFKSIFNKNALNNIIKGVSCIQGVLFSDQSTGYFLTIVILVVCTPTLPFISPPSHIMVYLVGLSAA